MVADRSGRTAGSNHGVKSKAWRPSAHLTVKGPGEFPAVSSTSAERRGSRWTRFLAWPTFDEDAWARTGLKDGDMYISKTGFPAESLVKKCTDQRAPRPLRSIGQPVSQPVEKKVGVRRTWMPVHRLSKKVPPAFRLGWLEVGRLRASSPNPATVSFFSLSPFRPPSRLNLNRSRYPPPSICHHSPPPTAMHHCHKPRTQIHNKSTMPHSFSCLKLARGFRALPAPSSNGHSTTS